MPLSVVDIGRWARLRRIFFLRHQCEIVKSDSYRHFCMKDGSVYIVTATQRRIAGRHVAYLSWCQLEQYFSNYSPWTSSGPRQYCVALVRRKNTLLYIFNILQNVFIWNNAVKIFWTQNSVRVSMLVLDWNLQEARRRWRSKQTRERTVLEEAGKCGKTRSEVKGLAGGRVRRRYFKSAICS
jgi:hypothetical protein